MKLLIEWENWLQNLDILKIDALLIDLCLILNEIGPSLNLAETAKLRWLVEQGEVMTSC